ncbi:MAG TPA: hypothetical protein VHP31_02695 [Caproicibacter sp.]|nr:hypothetical protein [Caproicibacter sp.]
MNGNEEWPLYDGRVLIDNGAIRLCKTKGKKEKVCEVELGSVYSMEKELKHDWVRIQFETDRKIKRKEFNFKNAGDGSKFINAVLSHSSSGKFEDSTKEVSVFDAVRKPFTIFFYFTALIALIMAIAYGVVYLMQILKIETVHIPVLLYIPMQIVYALGIGKCLAVIGIIGLLCAAGALVRLIKRPSARMIKKRGI